MVSDRSILINRSYLHTVIIRMFFCSGGKSAVCGEIEVGAMYQDVFPLLCVDCVQENC